ncbi:hypothetical protein JXB02_05335 [Candidatus Woesearchaeota archaeon]|nr:hypothetical protein [Candidatus Woesearchaeota archaeon]
MFLVDNIFTLDPAAMRIFRKDRETDRILVSHAHYDHIPSRFNGKRVLCSDPTRRILRLRTRRKTIEPLHDSNILSLDAGHTIGSNMFYWKDEKVLYTGDFCTTGKYCGKARPKRCGTLIVEATFGKADYIFPDYGETAKELIDFVKDKGTVIVKAYTFGKAQEVCHLLSAAKIPFNVSPQVERVNRALGLRHLYYDPKATDVLVGNYALPGYTSVGVSGWAVDPRYRYRIGADAAFPISNHCDYPQLVDFILQCRPEKVYTFHGFAEEFAGELRRAGIDAQPIVEREPGQALLDDY